MVKKEAEDGRLLLVVNKDCAFMQVGFTVNVRW